MQLPPCYVERSPRPESYPYHKSRKDNAITTLSTPIESLLQFAETYTDRNILLRALAEVRASEARPIVTIDGGQRRYATEDELLDFANKVREAGGADPIEALMPSKPKYARQCLIANALNFSCVVDSLAGGLLGKPRVWAMFLPEDLSDEQKRRIADAVGSPIEDSYKGPCVRLPEHIGNAAAAFDEKTHDGWVAKYRAPETRPVNSAYYPPLRPI